MQFGLGNSAKLCVLVGTHAKESIATEELKMNKSIDEAGDATPDYSSVKPDSTTGTPLRPTLTSYPEDHEDEASHSSSEDDEADESFYNPEPPLHLLQSSRNLFTADSIGDTAYSKHWLFTILMDLIQAVENHASAKEADESMGFDLDENLQDELCQLWDMSMNEAVVSFLLEFKVSDILMGVLERSKTPRATEICLGILGNMCCNEGAASVIASNERLIGLILMHLNESDTPTLVETMRCLHTCVSSSTAREPWCDVIRNEPTIYDNSRFILQSSTNVDLLKNASQFVDEVMDADERICEMWSTQEMILAVLEAVNQFGVGHDNDLNCLFHILQLLSTNENGVVALVTEAAPLCKVLLRHLVNACDDEIVGVLGRENFFASIFSVFNTILTACDEGKALVLEDYQLTRCLLKCLDVIYPTVNKDSAKDLSRRYRRRRTTSSGHESPEHDEKEHKATSDTNGKKPAPSGDNSKDEDEEEEYNETMVVLLYETMQSLLSDVVEVICSGVTPTEKKADSANAEQSSKDSQVDSTSASNDVPVAPKDTDNETDKQTDKDGENNNRVSVTLTYLNDQCSRERLYFMVWTLKEKSNNSLRSDHFELLQTAAKANSLERLTRILAAAEEFL